jgi:hypothetical protein
MAIEQFKGGSRRARAKLNTLVRHDGELATLRGDGAGIGLNKGAGGTSIQLNVPAVQRRIPRSIHLVFPVLLTQVGGSQGTDIAVASWTYDVKHGMAPDTQAALLTAVNPTASPHMWRRPTVGVMIKATFGYAHYDRDGALVLGWINEVVDQVACYGTE